MIHETISSSQARRIYDRLGRLYDGASFFESQAKARALEQLDLSPGMRVLNAGVGTGLEHLKLRDTVGPQGLAVGLDLSPVMARLAASRTGSPMVEADAGFLPFEGDRFDRLYAAYLLDLLPGDNLLPLLQGFRRVLKSGGRLVVLCLTEGVDWRSRRLVAAWKRLYAIAPTACAGCRPLQVSSLVSQAGFLEVHREVIVQWGVPSELVLGIKR